MNLAPLTMTCLLFAAGQLPADVWPTNHRNLKIGIDIEPARRREVREMILFVSTDEGKSWHPGPVVSPQEDAFVFYAPDDGLYWFKVAATNLQGKQEPDNLFTVPPDQKVLIDTRKPQLRIASAQRMGDEIAVSWEAKEPFPDYRTLKLEYCPAEGPSSYWTEAPIIPGPDGQARFRPPTPGPMLLRLQLKDLSGNVGVAQAEVPGDAGVRRAAYTGGQGNDAVSPPGLPGGTQAGKPPFEQKVDLPPPLPPGSGFGQDKQGASGSPPQGPEHLVKPRMPEGKSERVGNGTESPPPVGTSHANTGPSGAGRASTTPAQLVNSCEIDLEYELTRVGPSGVGSVELWLTRNHGTSWERFADDPDVKGNTVGSKYQRRLELPGEGVYGLWLVLRSRAGLGKAPPRPGDAPQMVIEVDLTPPEAQLFAPRPDPQKRDSVLLTWRAKDRNLTPNPITLEWAEQREGPWQLIKSQLPNTGAYSWKVPANLPVNVYLRVRVHDIAGNEGVDVTAEPQPVDLTEPEGRLLPTVRPVGRLP